MAALYTASSGGESEPDMCVISFDTNIISLPSGYSFVFNVSFQQTMPQSL